MADSIWLVACGGSQFEGAGLSHPPCFCIRLSLFRFSFLRLSFGLHFTMCISVTRLLFLLEPHGLTLTFSKEVEVSVGPRYPS